MAFDLGAIFATFKVKTDEVDDGLKKISRFGDQATSGLSSLQGGLTSAFVKAQILVNGLEVVARKTLEIGAGAVKIAADYEQSLNMFKAVSGATSDQMKQVGETARQLGKDVSLPGISAKDAALAMVELAKAGLSVNDTLAASKGVLALAKAGNLDTAYAAEVAANALNAFRMKGEDASKVADILAAAANASSAGVNDLAFGLQMASASASSMKVPLTDTVAILGELANNGLRGSDAGTSLKTFMMNFTPTTEKAASAMRKLNLDFYDAKGNFVGMREVIKQLQAGTKDLTDEQKAMNLETIFGSDSVRAANILLKEGVEGYDKMTKAVNRTGAATELAAAQNAGFNGALDNFKSTIETLAIDVGVRLLPVLTRLISTMTSQIEPAFLKAQDGVRALINGWRDGSVVGGDFISNMINVGASLRNAYDRGMELYNAMANYLEPKFTALWNTLRNDVIPAVGSLVQTVGPTVGAGLVWAIGLAADVLNALLSFISDNTWIVLALAAAFVAVRTAMMIQAAVVAFQGFMTLAAASAMATTGTVTGTSVALGGLRMALMAVVGPWQIVLAILGVAAVIAGIVAVGNKLDDLMNKWNKTKQVGLNSNITVDSNSQTGLIQQLRNAFGGFRASGGPVRGGLAYMVGENADGTPNATTEIFVPNESGTILSARDSQALMAGGGNGGGSRILIDLSGATITSRQAAEEYGELIGDSIVKRLGKNVRF